MEHIHQSSHLSTILGSVSLALFIYLGYLWILPNPIPNVPHNPISSVWGDIPEMIRFVKGGKRTFADFFGDMARRHGPISQIMVGRSSILVVADAYEAERLLIRGKNTDMARRTNAIFAPIIPTGQIALPANETWRRHRRLTAPSMNRRYLKRMSTRISATTENLVRLWARKVELVGDKSFDVEVDLQLATIDTIVDITTGASPGCIDAAYSSLSTSIPLQVIGTNPVHISQADSVPLRLALRVMMKTIQRIGSSPSPALSGKFFTWASPEWRRSYSIISNFFSEGIAEARERETKLARSGYGEGLASDADCVVDMLIQRETRDGAESFGKNEMLDELLTYVIAGQDSAAASLAWLVKFLPLDAEIQRRLHEEVCTVLGSELAESESLDFDVLNNPQKVPVLEAVVAETLRCAGVASLSGRELLNDEVILGRHIPKGTQLMFPIWYMATLVPDWGSDAEVWRPSRWLRPDGSFDRAAGPSTPFGLGQRSCSGQRLAVLQLKMFAASLSRAFFFKSLPAEVDSWDAVQLVTRQPKHCYVSLENWPLECGLNV